MTADTQAQGDLAALAISCGFLPWPEQGDTDSRWIVLGSQLQAFAAALGQPSELEAMRMLWDDQSAEEKAHYLGVVARAALAHGDAARAGGEGRKAPIADSIAQIAEWKRKADLWDEGQA